ncbi:MAG: hypothetical protein H6813_02275 [Phycisphaeraceae bacterium]|nr:hypothetical protein [Phycisphaeraceae bacterium]MCB9848856.1 hypothetical protein [Phycisphaeraceae bacterium]
MVCRRAADPFGPGGAYRVSLDPHGPYWEKTLLNSPQGPIEGPGILHIHEFIEIVPPVAGGPAQPWTDWHEQFVTPGWGWADFSINIYDFDGFTSDDVMATVPGFSYMISKDTTSIWFDFDPIFPGTDNEPVIIEIWKSLDYNADIGGPYMPGSPIVLREYPTPTPGALALLGVGGLATMRRNR